MNIIVEIIMYIAVAIMVICLVGAGIGYLIFHIWNFIIRRKVPKKVLEQNKDYKIIKKEVENAREKRKAERIQAIKRINTPREQPVKTESPTNEHKVRPQEYRKLPISNPNPGKQENRTHGETKPDSKWDWPNVG